MKNVYLKLQIMIFSSFGLIDLKLNVPRVPRLPRVLRKVRIKNNEINGDENKDGINFR